MDRTIRMMRRTFLCAAFACPAALLGYIPTLLIWSGFSISLCFLPIARPLWMRKLHTPFARVAFSFAAGLLCCTLLQTIMSIFFPRTHFLTTALIRLLAVASGLSLQLRALESVRFVRRKYWLALGGCLLLIVCMQSIL